MTVQSGSYTNAAGTGSAPFPFGLNVSAGQVVQTDTLTNTTTSGGVAVQGIAGNTAGAAGYVGEVISAVVSTTTFSAANNAFGNITSITLSAGDWDISASYNASSNGSTFNNASSGAVSTTTASSAGTAQGQTLLTCPVSNGWTCGTFPTFQVRLASPTTYYLNLQLEFTGSGNLASGFISARRCR